jgi:magnesium chelatase subunit H
MSSFRIRNLDSVELGVTTVDNYFDTLGGISKAVSRARGGKSSPVYIGDQTRGEGAVRTLNEQVTLEARTRMLNPKWYEGMLKHGYEGVRQIEGMSPIRWAGRRRPDRWRPGCISG